MTVRVEKRRSLRQRSKQGPFAQRQRVCRFAEIAARRHLDAPGTAAKKDRVEIELQYLWLREGVLQPGGQNHFSDLALVGHLIPHEKILHHLLGNGRAPLRPTGLRQVFYERADQRVLIDSVVVIEALVLSRHKS